MISEEEIIEILTEQLGLETSYGESIWVDNKDLQNIASVIIDKIKEGENIEPLDYESDKPVKLIKGYQKPNKESEDNNE